MTLPIGAKPLCAAPEHLALVDAAFERAGGPESHELRERVCPGCPVRTGCLLLGNANGEHGIWGGLNTNQRVSAGGRSAHTNGGSYLNLQGIDHGRNYRPTDTVRGSAPAREVRDWARSQGIPTHGRGRPAVAVYEAYLSAHEGDH